MDSNTTNHYNIPKSNNIKERNNKIADNIINNKTTSSDAEYHQQLQYHQQLYQYDCEFKYLSRANLYFVLFFYTMFGVWDWVVFAATLGVSAGIGVYHAVTGGKQKTTNEFLMGDRKIGLFPVAISILVSFQSAILILGVPAEIYTYGIQYYLFVIGFTIGGMLAVILFVPLFYPLKLTSMYEVGPSYFPLVTFR